MGSLLPLSFLLYLFLQLSLGVHGRNFSSSSFTQISRDLYHSREVKDLVGCHPDRLSMESIEAQNDGYSAEVLIVTYSHAQSDIEESSRRFIVFQTFGQHGRELITSEFALRLLTTLCRERNMFNMGLKSLNHILDKLVIKVVPMENLNGRKLVEAGDLCERRNGRGVSKSELEC